MDNRFFKLPLQFDLALLSADLAACEARQWVDHFNKNDYDGNWTGISLRSASGEAQDIKASVSHAFGDTSLLGDCPYFREILASFPFEKETVRLLALAPGSVIRAHRDAGLGYPHGCFRLHIPITTDEKVQFTVDGCNLNMGAGECWYANFDLPHSVRHEGSVRRIHLVIDGLRNEASDALFGSAGYDFELEKKQKEHDPATKAAMIEHLKLIDSDAARSLIAQLEASLSNVRKAPSGNTPQPDSCDWVPTGLIEIENEWRCQWQHLGGISFTAPFFHETLGQIKKLPANKHPIAACSDVEFLVSEASKVDCVPPDAFIFHVSRCGSTLLSQILSIDPHNIVLSEVPLFDELLRLPYREATVGEDFAAGAFAAALRLMGRKRTGREQHLFVKTDCWHVFFYAAIRRLFPTTPILLLYRNPSEVLRSQQKIRGIQSLRDTLEPAVTGIPMEAFEAYDMDGYFSKLLELILGSFADIARTDTNTVLLNYAEGPMGMLQKLEQATGIRFSEEEQRAMEKRSLFSAKRPSEHFTPEEDAPNPPVSLEPALRWYAVLDAMRTEAQNSR